jgi:GNAT superfamily N-acetyltransferase
MWKGLTNVRICFTHRLPPGANVDGWWVMLRSGLWRVYFMLSPEGRRRYYDELLPLLNNTKLEVMGKRDNDCYYLVYLGTKPNARGRGYARRLLEDMTKKVSLSPSLQVLSTLSRSIRDSQCRFEVVR